MGSVKALADMAMKTIAVARLIPPITRKFGKSDRLTESSKEWAKATIESPAKARKMNLKTTGNLLRDCSNVPGAQRFIHFGLFLV